MRRLHWNTCTTFAAAGSALAFSILIPAFGWHWQLIPGGIAGLIAAYAVSTALGSWFARINIEHHTLLRLGAGVGAALLTLLVGALALAVANFLLATGIDIANAPSGQPFWNAVVELAPHNARSFVVEPVLTGLIYGQVPAFILGVAYGAILGSLSPREHLSTPKAGAPVYLASGSGVVLSLAFAGVTALVVNGSNTHVPAGVPVAIGGCGSSSAPDGVLAFCSGSPCENGNCDWDAEIDAIAVYVRGPENNQWRWIGGGMGSTTSPHIVRHHTQWVQPGPDGRFDESSPRRSASYEFRFDDENLRFRRRSFEFTPGMLFVVRYSDDWSYTVDVGQAALAETGVTVGQLQQSLDDTCAMLGQCDRGFQITE